MKTVLITGCSSGDGLETAHHLNCKVWKVIATMRTPREDILAQSERLRVVACASSWWNHGPTTAFASNGGSRRAGLIPEAYASFAGPIFAAFAQPGAVTTEADVAKVVWRAANDLTGQLRFPAGADAVVLAQAR